MDPNKNLQEQLIMANRIVSDVEDGIEDPYELVECAEHLASLVKSMNDWLSKKGALPLAWIRDE